MIEVSALLRFGWRLFLFLSALMRRAVPVSEDCSGFADDAAEGGVGVVFLRAHRTRRVRLALLANAVGPVVVSAHIAPTR